jgi:hypothetical protein
VGLLFFKKKTGFNFRGDTSVHVFPNTGMNNEQASGDHSMMLLTTVLIYNQTKAAYIHTYLISKKKKNQVGKNGLSSSAFYIPNIPRRGYKKDVH